MRHFSDLPIKHKLTLISLLTTTIALLLACAGFVAYELVAFKKDLVGDVSSAAEIIGYNSASALSFNDAGSAEQTLKGLIAKPHIIAACIYDKDGKVFATYPRSHDLASFGPPPAGATEHFGANRLDLFRPVAVSGENVGTIYLRTDLAGMRERIRRYALIIGAVMVLAIFVAYLIASRLQRVISAPVSDLVAVASRVAVEKDYAIRAVKRGDDELGRLIDGFNEMLAQIQARDSALQKTHEELEMRVAERTAKLAETSGLLEAMLENSPELIYFKDRESRFVRFSKSFLQQYALTDVEWLYGKADFDIHPTERARLAYADEQEIIRTGIPIVGKIEKDVASDGGVKWVHTTKMPWRDREGQIIGTFGISKDITELKETEEQLEQMHHQLLDTSRAAGMAEIATGVLHNVGNVLNSVNVSATLVTDHVRHTKAVNIAKLSALFEQHKTDLAGFITNDQRGQMIPKYLRSLAEELAEEQKAIITELENLRKNIEHIKDIVAMQQAYARTSGVIETVSVPDVIEDAVRINAGSLARHDVDIVRDYQARPVVTTDKHKVMQILINLVRNAKYACDESGRTDKTITVRTTADDHGVRIAVIDNGVGIAPENLTRIFNHGFTTRPHGHGFGLHSGALAAKELGGSLSVHSDGPDHGATFTLTLPYKSEPPRHEKSIA
jgi:PAS domain S-box-containing protein